MITVLSVLISSLGRRLSFLAAMLLVIFVALWVAFRRGRHAAEAEYVLRRAEARITTLKSAAETRHDIETADRAELDRRADRWMRD
jgi:ABC-type nickel/cobalt efflux system permease component RcnA